MSCSHAFAEANDGDSLGELADDISAGWRGMMTPIVASIHRWLTRQPSLPAAIEGLAGLLPTLPSRTFQHRLERGTFQARLAGLLGVPVTDRQAAAEAEDVAFADPAERVRLRPLTDIEALRYLTDKQVGARFSFDWRDVREAEHVTSFVVAKGMNAALLGDIHQALVRAMEQGWTRERFIRELTPVLQRAGWWGRQRMTDPLTGADQLVQLGSPRRLRTIFDVNVRMAHSAGRWERFVRVARPGDLLRYTAVLDERTREQHAAWHGTALPIDHPFWRTHYPPNGWNCRCTVTLISASRAGRTGVRQTTEAELEEKGFGKTRPWFNRRTGQTEDVPIGVDPGFAYNVGQARLEAFSPDPGRLPAAAQTRPIRNTEVRGAQPTEARPPVPAPKPPTFPWPPTQPGDLRDFFDAFRGRAVEMGVDTFVFTDAAQVPLVISPRLFIDSATGLSKLPKGRRESFLPAMAATILEPDEIWAAEEVVYDPAGRPIATVWRRRFVARWALPGTRQEVMTAVFEEDGSTWRSVTTFEVGGRGASHQLSVLDKLIRYGVLIWRRKF